MKPLRVLFVLNVFLAAASLSAGSFVPHKGSMTTTGGLISYCDPGDDGHVGLSFQISGEGHLTQLSEVTDVQSHCLSLTTFVFAGQSTITGADGSTITGGIGRFAGATGSGGAGVGLFEPGTVSIIHLDCTVSSVGAMK